MAKFIYKTSSEYHTHQEKARRFRPQLIYIRSRLKNHTTSLDYSTTSEHEFKHLKVQCGYCGYKFEVDVMMNCGDRTCPVCRKKWYGLHYKKILNEVEKWKVVKTMTLTVRNMLDSEFNRETIKWLRDCFKRLRRRKDFENVLKNGFYVPHCTNRGNGWHPHLHIVYEGDFVDQNKLSEAWKEITGGSGIVFVREAVSPRKAVSYLLSEFIGKSTIRPQDVQKYNEVFKGLRLVQGFGECSKMRFKDYGVCPNCGREGYLIIEERVWDPIDDNPFQEIMQEYWDTS